MGDELTEIRESVEDEMTGEFDMSLTGRKIVAAVAAGKDEVGWQAAGLRGEMIPIMNSNQSSRGKGKMPPNYLLIKSPNQSLESSVQY